MKNMISRPSHIVRLLRKQDLELRLKKGIKSIDDIAYKVSYENAANKHYLSQEYIVMMENKSGGRIVQTSGN